MSSATKQAAQKYYDLGMTPIPVKFKDKKPSISGWQHRTQSSTNVTNDFPEGVELNIGIVLGDASNKTVDIDLDCIEAVRIADRILPETGMIFGRDSSPSSHWIYRVSNCPAGTKYSDPTGGGVLVEYRGNGGQTVFPPSIHTSGEAITFSNDGEPAEVDHDDLLYSVKQLAAASLMARHWKSGGRHDLALALSGGLLRAGWVDDDVRDFIGHVCVAAGDKEVRDRLNAVKDTQAAIDHDNHATGLPKLAELLGEATVLRFSEWLNLSNNMLGHNSSGAANDNVLRCSDIGNAEVLAKQHRPHLRYCYEIGSWLAWDGSVWKMNDKASVDRFAEQTVRSFPIEAADYSDSTERNEFMDWAKRSANLQRVKAMIESSHYQLHVDQDRFDSDPMLLNVRGASINLTDGTHKDNDKNDFCTKIASVKYDPNAECPQFMSFLNRIMGGSADLTGYLKRAVGYSLTGSTREQCFFIGHGSGANGKSVFLNLIRDVVGTYGLNVPMDTLMTKAKSGGINNDVARLNGARLVTAIEGETNQKMAESLVKQLTGGDKVTARFLYHESFEFVPELKLWMATNHKPQVSGNDPAIWRRIHLIPFNVVIPSEEQDGELPNKLRQEFTGILKWAIEGAIEWNRVGLKPPAEVLSATEHYRSEMDTFLRFCGEMIVKKVGSTVTKSRLFEAYLQWRDDEGGEELTKRELTIRMKQLGFEEGRSKLERYWKDVEYLGGDPVYDDFSAIAD
jgi:putative DNA primase/helicase